MVEEKRMVIFGSSNAGRTVYSWIKQNNIGQVQCFIDNSENKNNSIVDGLQVKLAEEFLHENVLDDFLFVVAGDYHEEMRIQLNNAGVNWENICNKSILAKKLFEREGIITVPEVKIHDRKVNIFDCANGFVLGGVEKWTYNLSFALSEKNITCKLISIDTNEMPPENLKEHCIIIKEIKNSFDFNVESVQLLVNIITQMLPCNVFAAHIDDIFIAAHMVQKKYPEAVRLISGVRGGMESILQEKVVYDNWSDKIFCVSIDAQKRLVEGYGLDSDKVLFKETPVICKEQLKHEYTMDNNKPIKIAYAARLEKIHKRSQLIINVIEKLERIHCNYILDIAGEGSCFTEILEWIKINGLELRVNMLGRVPFNEMDNFWRSHDIMINISECEGCCNAMLEAMVNGAIPILTDVFSVRHFIEDNINGYIVDIDDVEMIADKIYYLEKHRNRLPYMGEMCEEIINEKCSMNDYIEYFKRNLIC